MYISTARTVICTQLGNNQYCRVDYIHSCMYLRTMSLLMIHAGPRVPRGPEDEDEFSDWGEWTECSRTCGGGARSRRRVCKITETGLAVDCQGKTLDVQDCNTHLCAGEHYMKHK